jgi:hypothetical protein
MTTIKERSEKSVEKHINDLATNLLMMASYLNRLDIRQFTQTGLDRLAGNLIKAEKHCQEIENLIRYK